MAILRLQGVDTTSGQQGITSINDGGLLPGWLNVGSATSAVALGDLAAGDGTNELFYDASASRLFASDGSGNNATLIGTGNVTTNSNIAGNSVVLNEQYGASNSSGVGGAGLGVQAVWVFENTVTTTFAVTRTMLWRQATSADEYAQIEFGVKRGGAMRDLFILGNSSTPAGNARAEFANNAGTRTITLDMDAQNINIGSSTTSAVAAGDFAAGDGTRTLFWDASANNLILGAGSATTVIQGVDTTTGGTLTLRAGNGTLSGDLNLTGGSSASSDAGGAVTITGGASSSTGTGGGVFINGGTSASSEGGAVELLSGPGTGANDCGDASINAAGTAGTGRGGTVHIGAGSSTGGLGGRLDIGAGSSGGPNPGGYVPLYAGNGGDAVASTSAAGLGGYVEISGGNGGDGATGPHAAAAGGRIDIFPGIGGTGFASVVDGATGGAVNIIAGQGGNGASGQTGGTGGATIIDAGAAGQTGGGTIGVGGAITVGGTNATAITVGRTAIDTTIRGGLIGGAATGTTDDGDLRFGDGTNELNWDASVGRLALRRVTSIAPPSALDALYANGDGGLFIRLRTASAVSTTGAGFYGRRSRGTVAVPLVSASGDTLVELVGQAWDTSAFGTAGMVQVRSDGIPSSGSTPGKLVFLTTPAAQTFSQVRWEISSTGAFIGDVEAGTANIQGADAVTTATAGAALTISGGAGNTSGLGGAVAINGGAGGATGAGGAISITSGAGGATSGGAGTINIDGGVPVEGNGGSVFINASDGVGTDRAGGFVTLIAGDSTGTGNAGSVTITAGSGTTTNEPGARVNITGGGAGPTGAGGQISITGGLGGSLSGGIVQVQGGSSTTGPGGSASLLGGEGISTSSSGGAVIAAAGDGGSVAGNGGFARLAAGDAAVGIGGFLQVFAGDSGGANTGGAITQTAGAGGATGAGGAISITSGAGGATSGGAGGINLSIGVTTSGTPGTVRVNNLPLPTVLASVASVDLTTIGDTSLYTVPTGLTAKVIAVIVTPTTVSAPGADGIVSVGTNSAPFDNIIADTTLTGLNLTTESYTLEVGGVSHIGAAAEVITFRVDTADTGTTLTATVELIGYLV